MQSGYFVYLLYVKLLDWKKLKQFQTCGAVTLGEPLLKYDVTVRPGAQT